MIVIGIDPHKSSHTATALDAASHQLADKLRIEASLVEYRRRLSWAKRFDERRWAVENAEGLGRHLAQWLVARGESVVDVPATATARVRELSRGGRRKTDTLDAAAAASVAAVQGDARPVAAEDSSTVLRMLDERRTNLIHAAGGWRSDRSDRGPRGGDVSSRPAGFRRGTGPQADRARPGQRHPPA